MTALRTLLIFGFSLLLLLPLVSQTYYPVTWLEDDGFLASGYLKMSWKYVSDVDDLILYVEEPLYGRKRYRDAQLSDMQWVAAGPDTLLRRHYDEFGEVYLQLIYTGKVCLYAVVGTRAHFLLYQNQWIPLNTDSPLAGLEAFLPTVCLDERFPKRAVSRDAALAFVRQLNKCLGGEEEYRWIRGDFNHRLRIGVAYDWMDEGAKSRSSILKAGSPYQDYALELPRTSLTINYFPWASNKWLSAHGQFRLLRQSAENSTRMDAFRGVWEEELSVTNLYAYLGLRLEAASQRSIQPYVGGGVAVLIPLHFRYTGYFRDPIATFPGYPIREELREGQYLQFGFYTEAGINIRLAGRVNIGLGYRIEGLYQSWRHFGEIDRLNRVLLPHNFDLAPYDSRYLQAHIAFGLK